ncbi:hypothetical protein CC79DRAFT_79741 [Sarocladium strictum]
MAEHAMITAIIEHGLLHRACSSSFFVCGDIDWHDAFRGRVCFSAIKYTNASSLGDTFPQRRMHQISTFKTRPTLFIVVAAGIMHIKPVAIARPWLVLRSLNTNKLHDSRFSNITTGVGSFMAR